jgi:polysaccharide export outer membrane protein
MRKENVALMIELALISIATAGQRSSPRPGPTFPATPVTIGDFNLPSQLIGVSDLILLTVSDSPELSRSFRVDPQGNLNLPLLKAPISARGLMPNVLGDQVAEALRAQHLLVNPIVVVSVVDYAGRGVTVAGAVKAPTIVQDLGNLRVLGALAKAGGLLPEAGPEIIVEQPDGTTQRLSVRKLFDGLHPELNIRVGTGSQITVPECERVFVVGAVKRPGAFPFLRADDTTVLQLLALSGGLDSYRRNKAYIYRAEPGSPQKREIEIPLKRILDRKSPDVKLAPNDILYVPTNRALKASASLLALLSSQ